jgi:hypothetical protein
MRGRLGQQGQPALGHDTWHAGIVQGPQQGPQLLALAPDHHGQIVPGDVLPHMRPPKLAGHRGVLLRPVAGEPGLHLWLGGAVGGSKGDLLSPAKSLGEPSQGPVGGALEGEDVSLWVAGHHQALGGQVGQQPLQGVGSLLVIVDQHVIEGGLALAGDRGGLGQQPGEVDGLLRVQDLLVPAVEPGQLAPAAQACRLGPLLDLLG